MPLAICIRLEPGKLQNPDTDLRYLIPDEIEKISKGRVKSGGYDYEVGTDAMLIYMQATIEEDIKYVLELIHHGKFKGNTFESATVSAELRQIYPPPATK